ncbi:MAG: ankyrin repeat domain-containing protein [Spirochaetales bacterium]|nr:ankyrin repeat domain-containing protein [Spirochaetales bacterium]
MTDSQKLIIAINKGAEKTVLKLLKKGVNPDTTSESYSGKTPLHKAAEKGFTSIAKLLFNAGALINKPTDGEYGTGDTPLHAAVYNGYGAMARFLIAKGADIFALNKNGCSILDYACFSGLHWLVKQILSKGGNLNNYKSPDCPLCYAARGGHSDIVHYLRDKGAEITDPQSLFSNACQGGLLWFIEDLMEQGVDINKPDARGDTPLHKAATGTNTLSVAQFLIDKGASINAKVSSGSDEGATPLHRAARSGNLQVARLLVENGADINSDAHFLGTPLIHAAANNQEKMIIFLVTEGADISTKIGRCISSDELVFSYEDKTILFWAIKQNRITIIKKLISRGADVSAIDHEGKTPLHYAAQSGRNKIIPLLMEAGSLVDAKDNDKGYTPLMCAINGKQEDIAFQLISFHADCTVLDKDNNTILHHAAEQGLNRLVMYLIDNKADVNARAQYGETPLHRAIFWQNEKTAAMLLLYGARIDMPNLMGDYPLFYAAGISGNLVQMIIDRGGDVNRKNKEGQTPLHRSAHFNKPGAAICLIENKADIDIPDRTGRTPLYIAAEEGHFEIVKVLVTHGADMTLRSTENEKWNAFEIAKENNHRNIAHYLSECCGKTSKELDEIRKNHILSLYFHAIEKGNTREARYYINNHHIDINTQDAKGKTALHIAVKKQKEHLIKFLILNDADIEIKDSQGKTPLQLIKAKDTALLRILTNPPQLKEKVKELVHHIKRDASTERNEKILALLNSDKKICLALTSMELDYLKRINSGTLADIIPAIKEYRQKNLFSGMECDSCGRDTVRKLHSDICHGNPHTPAADTGIKWYCECMSCGEKSSFII